MVKNKLAMVDLDGTLIDTIKANHVAYQKALNEVGFDIDLKYYAEKCNGRSYKDFLPEIMGQNHPKQEYVHQRKIELYTECLKFAEINEKLIDVLRAIKKDYYIALVTTATKSNVEAILKYFNLTDLFDDVLTQDQMIRCKPYPDCYIETRKKFGISVENTLIFEDSETGIKAAVDSGCDVYCFKQHAEG